MYPFFSVQVAHNFAEINLAFESSNITDDFSKSDEVSNESRSDRCQQSPPFRAATSPARKGDYQTEGSALYAPSKKVSCYYWDGRHEVPANSKYPRQTNATDVQSRAIQKKYILKEVSTDYYNGN